MKTKHKFVSNVETPEPLPLPSTYPKQKVENEEDEKNNYAGQKDAAQFKGEPFTPPSTAPKK